MTRIRPLLILTLLYVIGFSGIFLPSCKSKSYEGAIVFTEVNGKLEDLNISDGIRTRIAALRTGNYGSQPELLTEGFYSARSPEISSDGASMLFSAKQKQDDKWQIWEMDLARSKSRKITNLPVNCFDPVYLPNGRVLFSRQDPEKDMNSARALVSCNSDSTDLLQVTFDPYNYSASSVLKDGRVLTIRRMTGPKSGDAVFMVLRPDGTKNELFYKGSALSNLLSRGWEADNGKIFFIESENGAADRSYLISIDYNRSLHSYKNLSSSLDGSIASVFPVKSGKLLVSYRRSASERYGICEFDTEKMAPGKAVFESKDYDIIEIVAVEKHEKSKKLPSEVDMGVKTGLLLCQDINFQYMKPTPDALKRVAKIRVMGKDSTLGEFDVEKDGSFYLKVISDTPFRIQSIDEKGEVVANQCGWIYLRPNERRGCVGCHEDPEIVPENKVSQAVKHSPVSIPVHISKVVEKKVSLE